MPVACSLLSSSVWAAPASQPASAGDGASTANFSLPLPSTDLPDGVVTVKVIGGGMGDVKVGQEVTLRKLVGDRPGPTQTAKSGPDGRARFEGVAAGASYLLAVSRGESEQRSQPFAGPPSGGLRFLLTIGNAGAMPPGAGGTRPEGAMPEGHPPVAPPGGEMPGGAMPPGHPPLGRGAAEEGGAAEIEPVKELEPGQVEVRVVKGRARQPVAGAALTVRSGQARTAHKTDAEGKVLLSLSTDEKAQATALLVEFDGLTYRSRGVRAPAEGGLRVTFPVYGRSTDPSQLVIGPGSHWVYQVGEGAVNVMQVVSLLNRGDTVFDPSPRGLAIALPERVSGAEVPEEERQAVAAEPHGGAVRLVAPVPPGRLALRLFYEIPYDGAALDFRQKLPFAAADAVVAIVGNDRVGLLGPALDSSAEPQASGKERLFPLRPIKAGELVELTLTDLPHRDRRALYAVLAAAALLALWGVLAATTGPRRAAERRARREKLMQQLVQLQRGKKKAEKIAQRRGEIVEELRQVWDEPW